MIFYGNHNLKDVNGLFKANFEYFIEETYECGIVLKGQEVKSLRAGHLTISDSYAVLSVRHNYGLFHCLHIPTSREQHSNEGAHTWQDSALTCFLQEKGGNSEWHPSSLPDWPMILGQSL